jgi:hypothetical protein
MPFPEDRANWFIALWQVYNSVKFRAGEPTQEFMAYDRYEKECSPEQLWHSVTWYLAMQKVKNGFGTIGLKKFLDDKCWNTDWRSVAENDPDVRKAMKPYFDKVAKEREIEDARARVKARDAKYGIKTYY